METAAAPAVTAAPAPAAREAEEKGEAVTAPLVGVFYAAPAPEEPKEPVRQYVVCPHCGEKIWL